MKVVQGDLITKAKDGHFDLIIHGCNCFCTMGAGIAKSIKTEFPDAYQADRCTVKGDRKKLGDYSSAVIEFPSYSLIVVNAYTQYDFKGRGVKADYSAIRSCMKKIKKEFTGKRIGIPKIGAGLAGGDWNVISEIIDSELSGETVTLVEYRS